MNNVINIFKKNINNIKCFVCNKNYITIVNKYLYQYNYIIIYRLIHVLIYYLCVVHMFLKAKNNKYLIS